MGPKSKEEEAATTNMALSAKGSNSGTTTCKEQDGT